MKYLPFFLFALIFSCENPKDGRLPFYGNTLYEENDTIYHTIQDFQFLDQDSSEVTNSTVSDQIYVADFFFTSCPTICPVMKKEMLRVYAKFENEDRLVILSHTIDPEYDTVGLLNDYAARLGVASNRWKFLTGKDKDYVYDLAETSYMSIADEDPNAPGGFVHSGAFLLVDKGGRVRGIYDGTVTDQVDILMLDIEKLLKEYE